MEYKNHYNVLGHVLSIPLIYGLAVPFVILDFMIELYQYICFPLYDIPPVNRAKYIRIDRHKLKYLSVIDKVNCAYCGYATGLISYWLEIAARTEKYWCGIKHHEGDGYAEPERHKDFISYGDEVTYCKLSNIKTSIRNK